MTTNKQEALNLITLKLSAFPVWIHKDQDDFAVPKKPAIRSWSHLQTKRPTREEYETWQWEDRFIGIACGEGSEGLEVIDFDVPEDLSECPVFEPWCALVKEHDPELFARLVIGKTPSGGRHVYYRAESISGNQKLAYDPELGAEATIETRGQGGYVVAPPSKGYSFEQGSFASLSNISGEERSLLMACAQHFDKRPPAPVREPRPPKQRSEGEVMPGEDFNNRADWRDLLEADGWTFFRSIGQTDYWVRPGKSRAEGHSATTNHQGTDNLHVFTSSAHPLEPGENYSKFGYWAAVKHGGDFGAAAKDLAAQGYGTPAKDYAPKEKTLPKETAGEDPTLEAEAAPAPSVGTTVAGPQQAISRLSYSRSVEEWTAGLQKVKDPLVTGIEPFDELTGGIPKAGITIIAGRPSHGKTTGLLNITRGLCESGQKTAYISYEESWPRLATKLVMAKACAWASNRSDRMETGYLRYLAGEGLGALAGEAEKINPARAEVAEWLKSGLLVLHDESLRADELARELRLLAERGYQAVVLDYAQKVKGPESGRYSSRQAELQASSELIREAVTETGQAVICGAQFNREGGKDKNSDKPKRAGLEHLRECGDLEQDAQLVIGLYNHQAATRDNIETLEMDPFSETAASLPTPAKLEAYVLKHRGGIAGKTVCAALDGLFYRIRKAEDTDYDAWQDKEEGKWA